jgi:diaminopimelate decarboxylase
VAHSRGGRVRVHHLLRPALLGTPQRVTLLRASARRASGGGRAVVAAPLCTSLDVLHPNADVGAAAPGDLLAFENAGAYGYTESMPLFLSHEWPAELGVQGRRIARLRDAPRVLELLDAQRAPFGALSL